MYHARREGFWLPSSPLRWLSFWLRGDEMRSGKYAVPFGVKLMGVVVEL